MTIDDTVLKQILVTGKYVSAQNLAKAEEFASKEGASFLEYLYAQGSLTPDLLGQAIAEALQVPYLNLRINQPTKDQILRIPEDIAKKYKALLVREDADKVVVATVDPRQAGLVDGLKAIFGSKNISLVFSLPEDIEACYIFYQKTLDVRFVKIIEEQKRIAPNVISEIINDAIAYRASDIHFEPRKDKLIIRFRIDGILQEAGRIDKTYYENILNRVKVQSLLKTDEHFSAQDGAIRYEGNAMAVDLRVSIIPTLEGEKVVMRLLSKYVQGLSLSDMGLLPSDQKTMVKASKKPFGMILVTGPTGSGKTTTLYAFLKMLNKPDVNIVTIEDPVEYRVSGLNQIQVNSETNLTFSKGLRSILRQDPNVILVGEIRDRETAEIAVNAALTGHLLFSTFHANNSSTSIVRLLNMGIEPFLLSSTLEVVVAQRLVRRICDQCKYSITYTIEQLEKIIPEARKYFVERQISEKLVQLLPNIKEHFASGNIQLYRGKGCEHCSHTGFKGRVAVFELIKNSPELQDMILKNPSAKQIWDLAKSQGSLSLFEDGMEKVKYGLTTIEELLRIVSPSE